MESDRSRCPSTSSLIRGRATRIIAHRGSSAAAPENTLAAFRQAWREGADGIELDVQLSRDRQVVVMHDDRTLRTTGIDAYVGDLVGAELARLDAGGWKGEAWAGEPVPFLRAVLAESPPGKRLFVEIKCGPEILPSLKGDLAAIPHAMEDVAFLSFDPAVAAAAKQFLIHYEVHLNVEPDAGAADGLAEQARTLGLDGLSLGWSARVTREFCARVRAAGLAVSLWCIDDPVLARRVAPWDIQHLMTNEPAKIRAVLGSI